MELYTVFDRNDSLEEFTVAKFCKFALQVLKSCMMNWEDRGIVNEELPVYLIVAYIYL